MKKPPSRPLGDSLDLRYVTTRRNASGKLRRYWQRPGHKLQRLPEGPEWAAAATHLNRAAEMTTESRLVIEGSVAWAVQRYRASAQFIDRAASTRRNYEPWLTDIEAKWGALPCRSITRRVVIKYIEAVPAGRPTKLLAAAVLRNVLGVAHDAGVIDDNPVTQLKIGRNKPRQAIWDDAAMTAFQKAAEQHEHGEQAVLFMWLLLYTGQRPVDVCAMQASHYDGDLIKVRQQKTGTLVAVPCHVALKAKLSGRKMDSLFLLSQADGRKFRRDRIGEICQEIRQAADLGHLQMRDLRRTAAVRLAEAGCSTPEIAAITGHSIERTERILEVYLPRTLPMGRAAILKWENKPGKSSNALDKSNA